MMAGFKGEKGQVENSEKILVTANKKLLKQEEQHKMESIKLRAKLSEARRVIKLKSVP